MKLTLLLLLMFGTSFVKAASCPCDLAVIQDRDGYTNVRAEASIQAQVIARVPNDKVFWFYPEEYDQPQEWIMVYVPTDRYNQSMATQGYMHRSRIKPLCQFARPAASELYFHYDLQPFNAGAHTIKVEENWYQILDIPEIRGTDGGKPRVEVKSITARVQGQPVVIPSRLYRGTFECTNNFEVRRKGNIYFVYQNNSDGAGGYELVWVLTKAGLKQRLAGTIY